MQNLILNIYDSATSTIPQTGWCYMVGVQVIYFSECNEIQATSKPSIIGVLQDYLAWHWAFASVQFYAMVRMFISFDFSLSNLVFLFFFEDILIANGD